MPLSSAQTALEHAFETADEQSVSFLLFSLGSELYGTPLLSTREVIKSSDIKSIPYMVPHFKGVINLRGQIISVIDLRAKFNITPSANEKSLILVVEGTNGLLGAVVDDLVSVEKIKKEELDQTASIETKIPMDFFLGVAKAKHRLVNMVDISACLSSEDLRSIKQASGL